MDISVSGAILAGGKAERMQGQEKGLQSFLGRPMVASIAQQLVLVCESVVINANRHQSAYRDLGFTVIGDQKGYHDMGPLGGLLACLEHADSDYLIVSPCDTPNISAGAFSALLECARQYPNLIHFLSSQSDQHPLHAVLPVCSAHEALLTFLKLDSKRSVMAFYHSHGCQSLEWDKNDELHNINYLAQLI